MLRRYEKKREAQQKAAEEAKLQSNANVDAAGLRQFGAGQAEALEAAFKSETVRQRRDFCGLLKKAGQRPRPCCDAVVA